jgi:hypothetical protein
MARLLIATLVGLATLVHASDDSIEVTLEEVPVVSQSGPPPQGVVWAIDASNVIEGIRKHDPSISAFKWYDEHGHRSIVIRNVFDRKKQNEIIRWAEATKAQRHVHSAIVLSFRKDVPQNGQPDVVVREVTL